MDELVGLKMRNGEVFRLRKSKIQDKDEIYVVSGKYADSLASYILMQKDLSVIRKCLKDIKSKDFEDEIKEAVIFFCVGKYVKMFTNSDSKFSNLSSKDVFKDNTDLLLFHDKMMDLRNSYLSHSDFKYENCLIELKGSGKLEGDIITASLTLEPHVSYLTTIYELDKFINQCEMLMPFIESKVNKFYDLMVDTLNKAITERADLDDKTSKLYISRVKINKSGFTLSVASEE